MTARPNVSKQAVEGIELVEVAQQQALDRDPDHRDRGRRQEQRQPVVDPQPIQCQHGGIGAQHVKGAMGEIHHAQQPEDDREAEAQHGVEGTVDQPEHELAQDDDDGDAEYLRHGSGLAAALGA